MHDNYDVKGLVHRLEQRLQSVDRLKNLQHLLSFDIFDVEFSPFGQAVHLTNYTRGGKVHRYKRFTYAERGELVSTMEFDDTGKQLCSASFQYDGEGRCVGWTDYDPSGLLTQRCVHLRAGPLLMSSTTSDGEGRAIRQEEFEYIGSKLVASLCRYYRPAGTLAETWPSKYNEAGQPTEIFGLTATGKPLGDGKYTFEYNADGWRTRICYFRESSDDRVPNGVAVFKYETDERGNWIKRHAFHRFRTESRWSETTTSRKLIDFGSP